MATAKKTTPRKKSAKKAPAKKATKATKKAPAKKTPAKNGRISSSELQAQIVKFMAKNKEYSSRAIVEGLGRKPGAAQGGPVVRALHALEEAHVVKELDLEEYRGKSWKRIK